MDVAANLSNPCLYAVLEVDIKASPSLIRRQYLKLAKIYHPDRHSGSHASKQKFQSIVGAFEILGDAHQRQQYDLRLLHHLDVEDYLQRFQGLILTACGLGMTSSTTSSWPGLDEPLMLPYYDHAANAPKGGLLMKA